MMKKMKHFLKKNWGSTLECSTSFSNNSCMHNRNLRYNFTSALSRSHIFFVVAPLKMIWMVHSIKLDPKLNEELRRLHGHFQYTENLLPNPANLIEYDCFEWFWVNFINIEAKWNKIDDKMLFWCTQQMLEIPKYEKHSVILNILYHFTSLHFYKTDRALCKWDFALPCWCHIPLLLSQYCHFYS